MSGTQTYFNPEVSDSNCDIAPEGYFLASSETVDGITTCVYGVICSTNKVESIVTWEEEMSFTDNMLVRDPIDGCVYQASDNIQNIALTLQTGLKGSDSTFYLGLQNLFSTAPSQSYAIDGFQDGNYFSTLWYKTNCSCISLDTPSLGSSKSFRSLQTEGNVSRSSNTAGGLDITVSEDCSGFLLSLNSVYSFEKIVLEEGTVTAMTLEITNELTGNTTTITNDSDNDIDYYLGETQSKYITETLATGEYKFMYTVTYTDASGTTGLTKSVSYCGKLICNCCLKKAAVTISQADCSECDENYKKKFLKAFALSKALEYASNTLTKSIMKKAIKERDALVNKITNCKDC